MERARIEQSRRGTGEAQRRKQFIELDRAFIAVFAFGQGQAHGDPHPEILWRFDPAPFDVQQIAIVNRLQTEVTEL